MEGEVPEGEKDWCLEWPAFWVEGELSTIDLGLPAAGPWLGSMGAGEGELLLKGFLRIEEPLSPPFVIMEMNVVVRRM
jgi:hypothetical protein